MSSEMAPASEYAVAFHRMLAGRFAEASGMAPTLSDCSISVTGGVAIRAP
jgi:hypothetical protein